MGRVGGVKVRALEGAGLLGGPSAYAGRVMPQGHAVRSIEKSLAATGPMELDAAKASDGGRRWRYDFPSTGNTRLAADGIRVFLVHGREFIALCTS
ncbi:hypothetical protein BX257_0038 [Streptomyces sp. 3212.3]|nr:hypothetical protein BX257_0038 [Streptomyces sp. 3212.3]